MLARLKPMMVLALVVCAVSACGTGGDGQPVNAGAPASSSWQELLAASNGPNAMIAASGGQLLIGADEGYTPEGKVVQADWSLVDASSGKSTPVALPSGQLKIASVTATHDGFLLVTGRCPQSPVFEPGDCGEGLEVYFLGNKADRWTPVELPAELKLGESATVFPVSASGSVDGATMLVASPTSLDKATRTVRVALKWSDGRLTVAQILEPLRPTATCITGRSVVSLDGAAARIVMEDLANNAEPQVVPVPKDVDASSNGAGLNLGCTASGGLLFARAPGVGGKQTMFTLNGNPGPQPLTAVPVGHYIVEPISAPSKVVMRTTGIDEENRADGASEVTTELQQKQLPTEVANSYITTDGSTGAVYSIGPVESKVIAGDQAKGYRPGDVTITEI